MKTPHHAAAEFINELTKLGFTPAWWDEPDTRRLHIVNKNGHPSLHVKISYEGEMRPLEIGLTKYCGQRSQMIEWESTRLSARMPSKALIALIKASLCRP